MIQAFSYDKGWYFLSIYGLRPTTENVPGQIFSERT